MCRTDEEWWKSRVEAAALSSSYIPVCRRFVGLLLLRCICRHKRSTSQNSGICTVATMPPCVSLCITQFIGYGYLLFFTSRSNHTECPPSTLVWKGWFCFIIVLYIASTQAKAMGIRHTIPLKRYKCVSILHFIFVHPHV